jgi:hypothetical protein
MLPVLLLRGLMTLALFRTIYLYETDISFNKLVNQYLAAAGIKVKDKQVRDVVKESRKKEFMEDTIPQQEEVVVVIDPVHESDPVSEILTHASDLEVNHSIQNEEMPLDIVVSQVEEIASQPLEDLSQPAEDVIATSPVVVVQEVPKKPEINTSIILSDLIPKENVHNVIPLTIDELRAESLKTQKEISKVIEKELLSADEKTLRYRLAQLSGQFYERSRWEIDRLHDALTRVEKKLSQEYDHLLSHHKEELQMEANKEIQRLHNELKNRALEDKRDESIKFLQELNDQLYIQERRLRNEADIEVAKHVDDLRKEYDMHLDVSIGALKEKLTNGMSLHLKLLITYIYVVIYISNNYSIRYLLKYACILVEMRARQDDYEKLVATLEAFHRVVEETQDRSIYSSQSHVQAAAVLALERALSHPEGEDPRPLQPQVDALKLLCKDDEVIVALLSAIPSSALDTGVPSLFNLRTRFHEVRNAVRKSALSPSQAPPALGQAIGSILASMSWAPSGHVPGDGFEEKLSRASHYLEEGNTAKCLSELESLDGYAEVQTRDWRTAAEDRAAVDKIVQGLRAAAALKHLALSSAYAADE